MNLNDIAIYVTGFTKTILIGTRNKIQFIFITDYYTYTLALPKNTKHIAIDGQVCFHWRLIADPGKPPLCNTGSVGPVGGTNKDVTGARLLPTTVSTCPVDSVPFCHSLKTRGEAIMPVKLSIILFSNSHNFTYYAHRFYLLFSKLCLI